MYNNNHNTMYSNRSTTAESHVPKCLYLLVSFSHTYFLFDYHTYNKSHDAPIKYNATEGSGIMYGD